MQEQLLSYQVYQQDAIAALSAATGYAPRALIRISGKSLLSLTSGLLLLPTEEKDAPNPPLRLWLPGRIQLSEAISLPVSFSYFKAPASFTGEEMIEVQLPGNPRLIDRVLAQLQKKGIRLAQPGEFTFRAFISGKLDLSQAEGIMATIHAANENELNAAAKLRSGKLGQVATQMVEGLAHTLALLEAGIDFTDEEDVIPIPVEELLNRLKDLLQEIHGILLNCRRWTALSALPRVTMIGPPSSGKSTLFNHLLNKDRAVIDEAHGTTRDIIEEPLTLVDEDGASIEMLLTDMAGLDSQTDDQIEMAAQTQAQSIISESDLLLVFIPPNEAQSVWQKSEAISNHKVLFLYTKSDLREGDVKDQADSYAVSILDMSSLIKLKHAICHKLNELSSPSHQSQQLVLQPRHENALELARRHLNSAISSIRATSDSDSYIDIEVTAAYLRGALDELASLGGQVSPDDIIGKIFSQFCIGK